MDHWIAAAIFGFAWAALFAAARQVAREIAAMIEDRQ